MARYELASYLLTISIPTRLAQEFGESTIKIGGQESYLESINISYATNMWNTVADSTGSYVQNKSNDRSGTVTVTLSMLADQVDLFKRLCNILYNTNEDFDGLILQLSTLEGNVIATCIGCQLEKIADQNFQAEAQTQTWTFTCGQITMQ